MCAFIFGVCGGQRRIAAPPNSTVLFVLLCCRNGVRFRRLRRWLDHRSRRALRSRAQASTELAGRLSSFSGPNRYLAQFYVLCLFFLLLFSCHHPAEQKFIKGPFLVLLRRTFKAVKSSSKLAAFLSPIFSILSP